QLNEELDRIGDNTEFNTRTLLNGDYANNALTFHIGSNQNQNISVNIGNMKSTHLGSSAGAGITTAGSVNTNFTEDGAGDPIDVVMNLNDGTNDLDITLDQDFKTVGNLAEHINNAINNDVNFRGKV